MLTKIPLTGYSLTYEPPLYPQVFDASTANTCVPSSIVARFYKGTIYVVCKVSEEGLYLLLFLKKEFTCNPLQPLMRQLTPLRERCLFRIPSKKRMGPQWP